MINNKILEIRNSIGLSQKDFAEKTGISYGTYQSYEYGNQSPRYDYLLKISQMFDVPMSFFFDDKNPSRFVSDSFLIRKSDSLVKKDDTIQVPIYDVYASAGSGLLNDEQVKEYVGLDKSFLRQYFGLSSFLELSIITARGDSMMPTIPENCQLLIQKSQSFQEGQICVVRIDDELYVKRLQKRPRYKLLSDNKAYDDIELEGEDYEIIGIVVGMFKKML